MVRKLHEDYGQLPVRGGRMRKYLSKLPELGLFHIDVDDDLIDELLALFFVDLYSAFFIALPLQFGIKLRLMKVNLPTA